MRYLKKYYDFFENTSGSGDIFIVDKNKKEKKRKKGNPSEVSDLRFLKKEKNIKKIKESYSDIEDYINDIISVLRTYNVRPNMLQDIIDHYYTDIEQNYNDGKFPKIYANEIVKELNLDSGGYPSVKFGSPSYNNVIKYL